MVKYTTTYLQTSCRGPGLLPLVSSPSEACLQPTTPVKHNPTQHGHLWVSSYMTITHLCLWLLPRFLLLSRPHQDAAAQIWQGDTTTKTWSVNQFCARRAIYQSDKHIPKNFSTRSHSCFLCLWRHNSITWIITTFSHLNKEFMHHASHGKLP